MSLSAFMAGAPRPGVDNVFETLAYRLFYPRGTPAKPKIVGLTSCHRGEGVTRTALALEQVIRDSSALRTTVVDPGWLRLQEISAGSSETKEAKGDRSPLGLWERQRLTLDRLRQDHDVTLIDCPALEVSASVLSLAPVLEGVLLIVEANRTKRAEIREAERRIAAAGGKIVGLVLNKA